MIIIMRAVMLNTENYYISIGLNVVELSLLVTCNDISVIYVTAQMCRRTEEVVPTVGLPTP